MPIGRKTKKRLQSVSRKNKRGKSKKIGLGRKKIGGVFDIIKSTRDAPLNSAYYDTVKKKIINEMEKSGSQLEAVDKKFKNDKDVVKAAVTKDGLALKFADDSLKKDEDIVLAAVTIDGLALEFADDSLKKDSFIVNSRAVQQNGLAFKFVHPENESKDLLSWLAQNEKYARYKKEYNNTQYY